MDNTDTTSTNTFLIGKTKTDAVQTAVESLIKIGTAAINNRGLFTCALSGGSTPKAIYQELAKNHKNSLDWSKVHLFWSDERCVSPDNSDSNYKMAMDNGIGELNIPEENIHRLKGEIDPKTAALEYEQTIQQIVPDTAFDLIMLGMGDDGHTASLFPGTTALEEKTHLVVANLVEKVNMWRLTFTYPLIQKACNKHLYVLGEGKAEMVKQIILQKKSLPISYVGTKKSPAIWILDQESGKFLNK